MRLCRCLNLKNNIGFYIHVPFCVKKCNYCDFYSLPLHEENQDIYVNALVNEIESYKDKLFEKGISSIYFGGGTPSLLKIENVEKILDKIYEYNVLENIEITFECNPETLTLEYLKRLKKTKINRLSIGMQSMNNDMLKYIGRIHTKEKFIESYENARKVGFNNISIDIMFGFFEQTLKDLQNTIYETLKLNPEHISCYSLILEEGTKFYNDLENKVVEELSEDLQVLMYESMVNILKDNGFERYEISNFSKYGYNSKHNKSYWENIEYIGFGPSASSFFENKRYKNKNDISIYIKNNGLDIKENIEIIDRNAQISEFFFLGLRMDKGVSYNEFYNRFNTSIDDLFANEIQSLIDVLLLEKKDDTLKLTDKGISLSNYVFEKFII